MSLQAHSKGCEAQVDLGRPRSSLQSRPFPSELMSWLGHWTRHKDILHQGCGITRGLSNHFCDTREAPNFGRNDNLPDLARTVGIGPLRLKENNKSPEWTQMSYSESFAGIVGNFAMAEWTKIQIRGPIPGGLLLTHTQATLSPLGCPLASPAGLRLLPQGAGSLELPLRR